MKTKHTPGPWQEVGIVGERFNIMAGTHTVAHVVMDGVHVGDAAAYANARLIASAPDLLTERDRLRSINAELVRALESLLAESQFARANGYNSKFLLRGAEEKARAALARAKGEPNER